MGDSRRPAASAGTGAGAGAGAEPVARWHASLPREAGSGELDGASLRWFDGGAPTIEQPALDADIVALHLGGAKRVHRWQGRARREWDVPRHAVTLMPAGRANRWRTEGVVAYAHLALGAGLLGRLAREEFDRAPGTVGLRDAVAVTDPLVSELMLALLREVAAPGPRRLYRDSLVATLGITVLARHSDLAPASRGGRASGGLAPWQLRRVREHMAANAARDVGLDELVRITGLSRAQFFRAFRRSTGSTPARELQALRMRQAAGLLEAGRAIAEVAERVGFSSASHFAAAFRRHLGANPSDWRRARAARAG